LGEGQIEMPRRRKRKMRKVSRKGSEGPTIFHVTTGFTEAHLSGGLLLARQGSAAVIWGGKYMGKLCKCGNRTPRTNNLRGLEDPRGNKIFVKKMMWGI